MKLKMDAIHAPIKQAGTPIIIAYNVLLYPYLSANPVPTVIIVLGIKINSHMT